MQPGFVKLVIGQMALAQDCSLSPAPPQLIAILVDESELAVASAFAVTVRVRVLTVGATALLNTTLATGAGSEINKHIFFVKWAYDNCLANQEKMSDSITHYAAKRTKKQANLLDFIEVFHGLFLRLELQTSVENSDNKAILIRI